MPSDSKASGKRDLSEIDICDLYITPSIKQAGWDSVTQIRREVTLTPGPVVVRGNVASRNKKKKKFADYVLYKELGVPVAVIEAKDNKHTVGLGLQQALDYAAILNVPSLSVPTATPSRPTTRRLFRPRISRPSFRCTSSLPRTPYGNDTRLIEDQGRRGAPGAGTLLRGCRRQAAPLLSGRGHQPHGRSGGGRTAPGPAGHGDRDGQDLYDIPGHLAPVEGGLVKRALFLADRNILVDQALINDFKPFGAAMVKVTGHKFDPAYEVHLALYQAITGQEESTRPSRSCHANSST